MTSIFDTAAYLRELAARDPGVLFSREVEAWQQQDATAALATVEVAYCDGGGIGLILSSGAFGIVCDLPPAEARALANALLMGAEHAR